MAAGVIAGIGLLISALSAGAGMYQNVKASNKQAEYEKDLKKAQQKDLLQKRREAMMKAIGKSSPMLNKQITVEAPNFDREKMLGGVAGAGQQLGGSMLSNPDQYTRLFQNNTPTGY